MPDPKISCYIGKPDTIYGNQSQALGAVARRCLINAQSYVLWPHGQVWQAAAVVNVPFDGVLSGKYRGQMLITTHLPDGKAPAEYQVTLVEGAILQKAKPR